MTSDEAKKVLKEEFKVIVNHRPTPQGWEKPVFSIPGELTAEELRSAIQLIKVAYNIDLV